MFDSNSSERRLGRLDQKLDQKQQVRLKTCADVYDYWSQCKRHYRKAPKDGVEFQIDYIDTGVALSEEVRSKAPIALALHGAPGSYHDFTLLINHLSHQNMRVIAPNFPEYVATVKTKVLFRHSADEKAAYLRDFLKAINITKIDLLVSHSSAIFPTLLILLSANNNNNVRQDQECQQQQQLVSSGKISQQFSDLSIEARARACAASKEADVEFDTETGEKFEDARDDLTLDGNNNLPQEQQQQQQQLPAESLASSLDTSNDNSAPHDSEPKTATKGDQPIASLKKSTKKSTRKTKKESGVTVKFCDPIEIKAVALFNPAGHRLPKSMKPTWFKCGSVRIYQHKVGRYWFRKLGPAFLTVIGVPVRVDNMDNVMLSATVMRNSRCQRVVSQLDQLSKLKLPTLLVFSENDKLIEKEIFYEMAQFMRLDPKTFDTFDNEGEIERSQSRKDDWIRVMVFKAGGHYAYSNYAKTVNKAVSELLDKAIGTGRHSLGQQTIQQ